jgi:RNA polymerase sigma-70 factor (ECF subfamily)
MESYEQEIIEKAKSGDNDAFCKLVEQYKEKALSIAFSLCTNYEDAKDLSQEAFIKAFKKIKDFKGDAQFYTWFYRILVNICRDYLRWKARHKMFDKVIKFRMKDGVSDRGDIFENIASDFPDPGKHLLNKELRIQLESAINSLPEKQRTVFILKNFHGLKISEIAEIMHSKVGTIKAHLFKAIQSLQHKLKSYVL